MQRLDDLCLLLSTDIGSTRRSESRAWQWRIQTERCRICISRWWIPNYRWRIWMLRWRSWDPAGSPKFNLGSWRDVNSILVGYYQKSVLLSKLLFRKFTSLMTSSAVIWYSLFWQYILSANIFGCVKIACGHWSCMLKVCNFVVIGDNQIQLGMM